MTIHAPYEQVEQDSGDRGPWWWSCEHPERPADEWCLWWNECDACTIHSAAAALANPTVERTERGADGSFLRETTAIEAHHWMTEWRESEGLAPVAVLKDATHG